MESEIRISLRTIQKFVEFINTSIERLNALELDLEDKPDKETKMNDSIINDLKQAMKILIDSIGIGKLQ